MVEKKIKQDGVELFYTLSGKGNPVVFIHGFAEDGQIWNAFRAGLEKEYMVLVPDLPGSGRSTGISEGATMDSFAESIKIMLDQEKIDSCIMIGHSMGGYITLAFADKYPERLRGLGLFHSTSYPDNEEKKAGRKKNIAFITRNGTVKFLEQSVPTLFSGESKEKNPALISETLQRYSNFSPQSLVLYTAAMMNRPGRTEILPDFAGPVLFILGEHDTAVPLEQSLTECHLPGISYIYVCTHSGHMGMLEEPEFCLNAVSYFLSGK